MMTVSWITAAAIFIIAASIIFAVYAGSIAPSAAKNQGTMSREIGSIALPPAKVTGAISVEEAIAHRRSIREYSSAPLDITDISQLLWAAQGITGPSGFRAAPSAGGLFPLEIYVACGKVTRLSTGVYMYLPESHALEQVTDRDIMADLYRNALYQPSVKDAAAVIIIAADYNRTTIKYGERGIRYVHMEAGHAAENIYIQAYTLRIGTVTIGAFDDNGIRSVTGIPQNQVPLYLMPVGLIP
jgi:SagB-type dehydrogenase family enzyme